MDEVAKDSHFVFYNIFWVNWPWKEFLKNKIKSLVNFGWNSRYLQISPILAIAIPLPFTYQGHFKFSGWPNKWNLNGFGCLLESCPGAGKNKCSVLPGGSSGSPSLLESIPALLPFLPSSPNMQAEWARKGLCDCYLMISHCWWLPPGVRMLWWDPCLRSHWFMLSVFCAVPVSLLLKYIKQTKQNVTVLWHSPCPCPLWVGLLQCALLGYVFEVHLADACIIISANIF